MARRPMIHFTTETQRTQSGPRPAVAVGLGCEDGTGDLMVRSLPGHDVPAMGCRSLCDLRVSVVPLTASAEDCTTETRRTQSGLRPAGAVGLGREGRTWDLGVRASQGHDVPAMEGRSLCDLCVSVVNSRGLAEKTTTETQRTQSGPRPAGASGRGREDGTGDLMVRSLPGHDVPAMGCRSLCDLCVSVVNSRSLAEKTTTETQRTQSGQHPAVAVGSCLEDGPGDLMVRSLPGHDVPAMESRALCDLCVSVV